MIKIRALEVSDAEFINSIRYDEQSESSVTGPKRIVSLDREREWIKEVTLRDRQDVIYMAIVREDGGEFLGYMSIAEIDYRNGSCYWSGTKILPDKSGGGIATQSAKILLRYVFDELRMERCKGTCLEDNIAAQKLIEKVGMKKEGLLRNAVYKDGRFKNVITYSILRDEYYQLNEIEK